MDEKRWDMLQHHSNNYLTMAFSTDHCEVIHHPDGYGKRTGDCGDTVEMFIMVSGELIESISFRINGCMNTHACANTVANLSEGKSIEEAWNLTPETIIRFLETLPSTSIHCAELAVGAFYLALTNYQMLKKETWKKNYQKFVPFEGRGYTHTPDIMEQR
ncbi:MAG: iron-sulfur cluster assembly scaffold protein [Desulfobacterales bacterium]|nr:iron-sulfur cluster assembly scaffold protein [Desulfobacterales bacterium]